MRLIDADEVVKFYKNMGKEFPELSTGVHFSINDIINNLDNIDTVKAEPERKKGNGKCPNKLPCGWCSLFDTQCFGGGGEQDG